MYSGAFRPISIIQAQVFKHVAEELHILLFLLSGLEKSVKNEMKNPTQLPNVAMYCISNVDICVLFKGNA